MTNRLFRHSHYLILALGFICSMMFAAEFDLIAAAGSAGESKHQRIELEELAGLSGLFSVALAVIAFFKTMLVSRERRSRMAVEQIAFVDPLTGLSNRRRFVERLEAALEREEAAIGCGLLLIDLNRFKQVNDTYGHAAGDAVLVAVADRLTGFTSKVGNAARLGGDEFAIILEGAETDPLVARHLATCVEAALREPFRYHGFTLHPSGSVGLALAGKEPTSSSELLEAADRDMYRAKRTGRWRVAA